MYDIRRLELASLGAIFGVIALFAVLSLSSPASADTGTYPYTESIDTDLIIVTDNTGYNIERDKTVSEAFGQTNFVNVNIISDEPIGSSGNSFWTVGGFTVEFETDYSLSHPYYLSVDSWGPAQGQTVLGGLTETPVGEGVFLLFKKDSSDHYTRIGVPVMSSSGCYQVPAGEIQYGTSYMLAYLCEIKEETSPEHTVNNNNWWNWVVGILCPPQGIYYLCTDGNVVPAEYSYYNVISLAEFRLSTSDTSTLRIVNLSETDPSESWSSMSDGALTTTGFCLDRDANPYLGLVIQKNGKRIIPTFTNNKVSFTDDGLYKITIVPSSGHSKNISVYVWKDGFESFLNDGSPVTGERVLDTTSDIPVFVSPTYSLKRVSHAPHVDAVAFRDGIQVDVQDLSVPGRYVIVLTMGGSAGDIVSQSFEFAVISEDEVPGPRVNHDLISGLVALPERAYSLTYGSEGPGDITLMFADRRSAVSYGESAEFARVVRDGDEFLWSPQGTDPVRYESAFDVSMAIHDYIEFGLFMYYPSEDTVTLAFSEGDESEDITSLWIGQDVVLFASEADMNALVGPYPVVTGAKRQYLTAGEDGSYTVVVSDTADTILVSVPYDSVSVTISDGTRTVSLDYEDSLLRQIRAAGFEDGSLLTILEENEFGRSSEYAVMYVYLEDAIVPDPPVREPIIETPTRSNILPVFDPKIVLTTLFPMLRWFIHE